MAVFTSNTPYNVTSILYVAFAEDVVNQGYSYLREFHLTSDSKLSGVLTELQGEHVCRHEYTQSASHYLHVDNCKLLLHSMPLSHLYTGTIAGKTATDVERLYKRLSDLLPAYIHPERNNIVPARFWSLGPRGATFNDRDLTAQAWNEIQQNYTARVTDDLDRLMQMQAISPVGRLILLHGLPGCGKTHSILTLAYEWRKWAELHYITDTERFFQDTSYMNYVIFGQDNDDRLVKDDDEDHDPSQKRELARLIVIEDADEMIVADAKDRVGQALSRLLNLTDGLVGVGTQTLVLITTNEPVERIHPAIKRAGRCLCDIEFDKLTTWESQQWASDHDITLPKPGSYALADLFSFVNGQGINSAIPQRSLGFV